MTEFTKTHQYILYATFCLAIFSATSVIADGYFDVKLTSSHLDIHADEVEMTRELILADKKMIDLFSILGELNEEQRDNDREMLNILCLIYFDYLLEESGEDYAKIRLQECLMIEP